MKKIASLMIALVLCLSMVAFAEEAPVLEEVTVELDETYVAVDLGENYAFTYMPADWTQLEVEYTDEAAELLGAFTNADGTAQLYVTYAVSETPTTYEEVYNQSVENGLIASLVSINGFEFVNIASGDENQMVVMSNFLVNEEGTEVISFTFSIPTAEAEAYEAVVNQILGGLNFYTE